uniref:DUF7041 domain-containing protein n=1 Tax=Bombyx mori TaxID=7091 RepID=A0A8R2LVY1_BOMMO|nr:uncharacterized protein LOC119628666 [Bombyx mori]
MAQKEDPKMSQEIYRVGVRIPPFCSEDPEMWFSQIEMQFKLSGISVDDTKFTYVSANLEPQYAKEVRDIITKPPASNKYEKLKTELIKRLSISQEKRVRQLLMHEELGDRKPSQFLRHLTSLAGSDVPSDFIITIWTSRLPVNVQTAVATIKGSPMEKLSDLADVVYEMAPAVPQVASASSQAQGNEQVNPTLSEMAQQINSLTQQISLLSKQVAGRSRSRNRSRRRWNGRSQSRSKPRQPPADHPYCFYHFTYGTKANKCKQPCSFASENSWGGRK